MLAPHYPVSNRFARSETEAGIQDDGSLTSRILNIKQHYSSGGAAWRYLDQLGGRMPASRMTLVHLAISDLR